jgi:prepilin-type N-terminal cleavage/methylation domain-containing protein
MAPVRHTAGFTLVELLVAITIIVLLLALLTPALDQAIYQAELAVCGANMRSTATGLTDYAMDFHRRYPHRPLAGGGEGGWNLSCLSPGRGATQAWNAAMSGSPAAPDLRPLIRPYVSINRHLNDPLSEPVDLDGAHPNVFIYSGYHLLAGWRYTDPQYGGPGMAKIGDRLTWNSRQFTAILADGDQFDINGYAMASHPDKSGLLANIVMQEQDYTTGQPITATSTGSGLTHSWWLNDTDIPTRGTIDRNVAFTDLSVERYADVIWPLAGQIDERMASVAAKQTVSNFPWSSWPQAGVQIPRR